MKDTVVATSTAARTRARRRATSRSIRSTSVRSVAQPAGLMSVSHGTPELAEVASGR